MKEIAELVYAFLTENSVINNLLFGQVYWGLAEEDVKKEDGFCTFSIQDELGLSKDYGQSYYVTLRVFGADLTQSVLIGDIVQQEINASVRWKFISGDADYVFQDNTKFAMRELKYKIR